MSDLSAGVGESMAEPERPSAGHMEIAWPALPATKRQEDPRFHFLKGIAILGVAGIHFGGSFLVGDNAWSPSFYVGLMLNQLFSFAVPLFVFFSGWLLEIGYGGRPVSWPKFYLRRFTKIFIPYLIASGVQFYLFGYWAATEKSIGHQFGARLKFFFWKVISDGAVPVLYFVPFILQLYLVYPLLRRFMLPPSAPDKSKSAPPVGRILAVLGLLFAVHLILGLLCWKGRLNYYTYCRPFAPFWAFFFAAGMGFPSLARAFFWHHQVGKIAAACGIIIVTTLGWNYLNITDPSIVGAKFERNTTDYAYCRPQNMIINFIVPMMLGFLLLKKWPFRVRTLEFLGRYSFYIYLWHLSVLYYSAWQPPGVMLVCRAYPEMVILLPVVSSAAIAATAAGWEHVCGFFRDSFRETLPVATPTLR